MAAGPKAAVDSSPLPFRSRLTGSRRLGAWCERFIRVPKGTGVGGPLRLHDWQLDLVGSVLDAEVQPRVAAWALGRGNGKSTLLAAWGLYALLEGGEGASVAVCACDERQAGLIFGAARRCVEKHPALESRVQIFRDRLVVPSRGASLQVLPATPATLEGRDDSLTLVDEIGVIADDTWQTLVLAAGKREQSCVVGIGTPGAREGNVLARLREYSLAHPDDVSQVYREFSAAGFEHHPVDCEHCALLANPAISSGFLHMDGLLAVLPPKTSEAAFRRARLVQWIGPVEDAFVSPQTWDGLSTGTAIPDGADVVLAVDGSFGGAHSDCTAILAGTVSAVPHFQPVAVWASDGADDYRVPILEVEQALLGASSRWNVREIAFDPFRWARTMQVLAGEGLPICEFPHSPSRLTAATTDLHRALVGGGLTHSGDPVLRSHVLAASVQESDKGIKLSKVSRARTAPKIDLAACLVMAYSRCQWLHLNRRRRRTVFFK